MSSNPTATDAQVILQLYDLRREAELRKARNWITTEFWPQNADDILTVVNAFPSQHNAWMRQVGSYWDMAATFVVQGALHESNPRIGGDHLTVRVADGESFSFGPDHIHRLNGAIGGAVSIHAYSPPLCRMGQYEFTADGLMRRVSVDYADELRAGAV